MSVKTKIEWTDAVWNPVSGCSKVSHGCKNCYAERLWPRLSAPGQPYAGRAFTDVRCHPERLSDPLRWRKPRRVFVNSMSDLFHEDVSNIFLSSVFNTMACAHVHTFQILTKRPARMREWFETIRRYEHRDGSIFHLDQDDLIVGLDHWPLPNVWLGVSVEDQSTADERIPLLLQTPAATRFISAEPLLAQINIERWLPAKIIGVPGEQTIDGLDWVICGGESGPRARPMQAAWAQSLRDQCQAAGVPFFFKQWGEWLPAMQNSATEMNASDDPIRIGKKSAGRRLDGRTWDEFPE